MSYTAYPPALFSLVGPNLMTVLQVMVAGCSGLPGLMVRPRFQPKPPTQPPPTADWCSVYAKQFEPTDYPEISVSADDGTVVLHRYGEVNVDLSFFGPSCERFSQTLSNSLYAPDNLSVLAAQSGLKLVDVGVITLVPDLVNAQYIDHADVSLRFTRFVESALTNVGVIESMLLDPLITDDGEIIIVQVNPPTT